MNTDLIVMIVAGCVALVSLGMLVWPIIRRHLAWRREFKSASRQLSKAAVEGNDVEFQAALKRFRALMEPEER